ncbi:MAG: hypothetical protein ACP5RW_09140 [bacterium]
MIYMAESGAGTVAGAAAGDKIDGSGPTGAQPMGSVPIKKQNNENKNVAVNHLNNMANKARSNRLTAELMVVGHPHIKSRACITILNVGEWSGEWYVTEAEHAWSGGAYHTRIRLLREVEE